MRRRAGNPGFAILAFLLFVLVANGARNCSQSPRPRGSRVSTPVRNPIEDMLQPKVPAELREGIAAAILIDTSGSMEQRVKDADGRPRPKIEIAQRAALDLVNQFETYAHEHAGQQIYVGIYEFSERRNQPAARQVIALGPPDATAAKPALSKMIPRGDTPIGDAMVVAKRDLDATGFSKRHLVVITDGENNMGYSPVDVTEVISRQAEKDRASVYFVAFDIGTATFKAVQDYGGLVLAAANEPELKSTLDYLLTGKILVEQPVAR